VLAIGRAALRVPVPSGSGSGSESGLVDVIYRLSSYKKVEIRLDSRTKFTASGIAHISTRDAESLYYYFLDEMRTIRLEKDFLSL
jgi:hypothetical protein